MEAETELKSRVPREREGMTLLAYLAGRFRYRTAEEWAAKIRQGSIKVNGEAGEPGRLLFKGDWVAYTTVLREPEVDRGIRLLHQEADFLVAYKPGQLPSHADGTFIRNTFIQILTERLRQEGWTGFVGLVHRLDRETSGLMLVAKDRKAQAALQRQFEKGRVEKEYLAVCRGRVEADRMTADGAIGHDLASEIKIRRAVVRPQDQEDAKPALTEFEVLGRGREASLLRCVPKTGRTNQIRVHLEALGHPLVGDKLYGRTDGQFLEYLRHVKAGGDPGWEGHLETRRHLLHASRLSFLHPGTGERLAFECGMPEDMRLHWERARS